MGHILEYALFQVAGFVLRLLPLRLVRRLGAAGGELVGVTLKYRRAVTLDNLRNAFPEWDQQRLESVLRGSFRSVGTALFEFMYLPKMTSDDVNDVCRVRNPELVQKVYSCGKGALMLTAHFGNWEMFAQAFFTSTGIPLHIITKPQANKFVDQKINRWRTKFGNKVVSMDSIREMLSLLRENKAVGIVADQTAAKESIAVPFFGREVPTYEGPAVLSLKTNTPLVAGFAIRKEDGNYEAYFEEIPSSDLREFSPQNVAELTRRHVALTESVIRQHPEQWMWMHKRWKHVPSRISTEKA
jgi:KDO2-lipid IV(A) lauroyltransferase